jgi:hypothetical protein
MSLFSCAIGLGGLPGLTWLARPGQTLPGSFKGCKECIHSPGLPGISKHTSLHQPIRGFPTWECSEAKQLPRGALSAEIDMFSVV